MFCLKSDGALKATDNRKWAHVSCALWLHGVYGVCAFKFPRIRRVNRLLLPVGSVAVFDRSCVYAADSVRNTCESIFPNGSP